MNLGTDINSKTWETQPSFSADGKTLYYIRRVKEKNGNTHSDIFVSELGEDGYWKSPNRLPDYINTQKNEESVFIHPDGQTLYFASNGHPGMGGLDIYITRRTENGEWGLPINIGYPINTFKNENSILISPDGKKAYFASDREGGFGGLDLYEFELPKSIQPQAVSYLAGKVIDAETRQPLGSKFELYNLENEALVVSSFSDQENGKFLVALPLAKNYALNVSKPGYLFHSENFTLKEKREDKPYTKNIELKRIKVGEKVILKNIFYATSKFNLLDESKSELKKLVDFLTKNSAIKIELGGHTDNVGSVALNQELSNNRAKEVYQYLVSNGIKAGRLSYKGFGANEPVATNDTEEGRAQNRRTEFKVIAIN
jgi:outer membrane protein OmpA-like peptidoglycan-associated protein